MYPVAVNYSTDGYSVIRIEINSFEELKKQLLAIKDKTAEIFSSPFSVDIVFDGVGYTSIGLAESTILCYKSWDLEEQLTAVGDLSTTGHVTFYFGDYSIMSKKYLIPYDLALEVVGDWINTGNLSKKVEWTCELF